MIELIIVLLIIFIIWYNWDRIHSMMQPSEHYLPCTGCSNDKVPSGGYTVLNPFIWPYSATSCTDGMYMQREIDKIASDPVPLTNPSTPDHAIQTN